jgi:anti-sigma factor RsiW
MHLTDEQLNEYLDHEAEDRLQIDLHLSTCEECSRRLAALQNLFSEIESLPDLELSRDLAARFVTGSNPAAQLPRSLTLTVTLQATLAMIAIVIAAPFVMQFLSPYVSGIPAPSFAELFLQPQSQWMAWLDMLSTFQFPAIPEVPVIELSSLFMMLTVIGVSLLWLIGNGLLLRNQIK